MKEVQAFKPDLGIDGDLPIAEFKKDGTFGELETDNLNEKLVYQIDSNSQENQDDKESISSSDGSNAPSYLDFTPDVVDANTSTEDSDEPCLTLRMWFLAFVWGTVIGGVDAFFSLRYPTINIGAVVALVLSYPCGEFLARVTPKWSIPLPKGYKIDLNPGPFNMREHACVFSFVRCVTTAGLTDTNVGEVLGFFKLDLGINRLILFHVGTYVLSVGLAGLAYDVLVTPRGCVWPSILGVCGLFKSIHDPANHRDLEDRILGPFKSYWKISRMKFVGWVSIGSFVWYWFPDCLAKFLSNIGAWISWIKPDSAPLSQVFGVKTGLGLFPLTFDWAQIASLSNPLLTPFGSSLTIFSSFVIWIWVVTPALYYTNKWQTAHFPIMTANIFDVNKKPYNAEKIVNEYWQLDMDKYKKYSPVMLPIAFIIELALGLAAFAAMCVNFLINFKDDVWDPLTKPQKDIHNKILSRYKKFHWSIYLAISLIGLGLGFAFSEGWGGHEIEAQSYFVAILFCCVTFVPFGLVEARTNIKITFQTIIQIIATFWYKGNAINVLFFFSTAFGTLKHAKNNVESLKIGHYMKVPPRSMMLVTAVAAVWAGVIVPSVIGFTIFHIDPEHICTSKALNNMTCRRAKVQYNKHLVWGLLGSEIFSRNGRYSFIYWFILAGVLVSIPISVMQKKHPKGWITKINPTLIFGGAEWIPTYTGFNYSTWFLTTFVFNFYIHRRMHAWWTKYSLLLAVGLEIGVAIAIILIYFAITYTGAAEHLKWWGNTVVTKGCDAKGCPYLSGPIDPKPTGF